MKKKLSLLTEKRDAQIFDDRAKLSIDYLLKLVMNISMSAIAISFISVTRKIEPELSEYQQISLLVLITFFSLSIIFGFLYAYIGYKRNQIRAEALRLDSQKIMSKYEKKKYFFHKSRTYTFLATGLTFMVGISAAVIFIAIRVKGI